MQILNLFLKNGNTQCQCGRHKTGSLIHSNGNGNNALLLESHLASGVRDHKDAWKLIRKKSFLFHRKCDMREDLHPCITYNSENLAALEISKLEKG